MTKTRDIGKSLAFSYLYGKPSIFIPFGERQLGKSMLRGAWFDFVSSNTVESIDEDPKQTFTLHGVTVSLPKDKKYGPQPHKKWKNK